ncbi:MAG: PEP/pyruvate-binding domain-containing protein [Candidatus Nanopelagicales bacterium]
MDTLEKHYKDLCDIEFTIERGKLWMLQTRVGKRTAAAAFRIAVQLVDEGLIDMDEAVRRVSGAAAGPADVPAVRPRVGSPGGDQGHWLPPRVLPSAQVVFDSTSAVARGRRRRGGDPGPQRDQPRRPARAWSRPPAS